MFSAENFVFADCLGVPPAILLQFSVKMCAASKNCEKFGKNPFWGVQGRSRSSMLINLKSLSSVLVMLSSRSACLYLSATVSTLNEPITAK